MLKQSRALETLSHGVTRQGRSPSPVYNAVTSPIYLHCTKQKQKLCKMTVNKNYRFGPCHKAK